MKKIILIILILFFIPFISKADGLTLSITPPLIKNNINPGDVWQSSIKIINNNSGEIEVYVDVADFKGGSGAGTVEFLPFNSDPNASEYLLSRWIQIEKGPIRIGGFKSKEIPFVIDAPEGASPGGHYAAIIVGTKSGEQKQAGTGMSVSTKLSSLILLNVNGDINEKGYIREFSSDKTFYKTADVNFDVVFENVGNVHIQPQGEIRVYNLFNKDKGAVTINNNTEFGNVLPDEKRKWSFNWQGENGIFEMGRYKAEILLGYGQEARQTESMFLYFWIIDLKIFAFIIGPFVILLLIIFIFVKLSIRKAIKNTKEAVGYIEPKLKPKIKNKKIKTVVKDKQKKKHVINLKEE
ncbi:hypothetical protein KAI92_04150 [Candidatus Parcubacteria bacterium]|nr:hypothetical protein [Candidatus Parcubacteria bacterium]